MIHEHISFGYDYDDETNTLKANPEILGYGFFSTFTLLLTSIIQVYIQHNKKLPNIDGRNILWELNKNPEKDMYRHFFEIDPTVNMEFDYEVPAFNSDMHHHIYSEENLKYLKPFFDRYFKLNHHIEWKYKQLMNRYSVDSSRSISLIIRGTDKWTDFGGMTTLGPGAYIRMAELLVQKNPSCKVLLQTEHEEVKEFCTFKFPFTFFEETQTVQDARFPLFISHTGDKLDWAEWYVASLWVHARSRFVITYSGNSALFVYLARGTTENFYQEVSFKTPMQNYFVKNVKKDYGVVNLKMSVGEILDRYSICLLKEERLKIDVSDEIQALADEIANLPEDIKWYIRDLKEVNGQIWNLEADLRKGNEATLGYEEIGRRAIQIRNFNNTRVELKNKVNSILNSGFIDVKGNHGSEKIPSLVISLTTVPERLALESETGLKAVIRSLCEQTDKDYEVHFNIPHTYNITGEEYIIPEWLHEHKKTYPHLKVFRVDDIGPPTKFVPTITRVEPETIILVVDDDLLYHEDMVREHRRYQAELPNSVICYEGRGSESYYHDIRDSWVLCVTRITETHGLQHYKSASYKAKLFNSNFFDHYLGKTLSDDVLVSRYFRDSGIKMYSVPYEPDIHKYDTLEKWQVNGRVETFPVSGRADSVLDTGCNHKKILEIQPKFYEPPTLGQRHHGNTRMYNDIDLGQFDTDKNHHGYMRFYKDIFDTVTSCEHLLEIGVSNGESLRMFAAIFPNSKIHGIDVYDTTVCDTDRIKTYIADQSNRDHLNNFLNESNCEFDIILDDGGHTMLQQQVSFGKMFRHLKSGGIYIIEDLHTSRMDRFEDSNCDMKTLDLLENFKQTGKIVSNYMLPYEKEYLENNIDSVTIWSRTKNFAESVTSVIRKK